MAKARRKKKRTQQQEHVDPSKKGPPKSFVWAHGSKRALVRELCADVRSMMQPHTAVKLRVSQRNVLKDFVHIAGPLGITHFVVLTATEKASYLKLCKSPRGPTVVLKVLQYSLARDVQASLRHPRRPDSAFQHPPLVVLQGFGAEQHMKLTAVLFQNMFPSINVSKAKLSECQRVILLVHNKEAGTISLRHYCISVAPSGLTKGVKTLIEGKKLPDLSKFTDVADFIEKSGMASESEGEEAAASRVTLPQNLGRNNMAQRKSRVKLHEIGPRLELQLFKVQEGLAEGRVLYHSLESRTAEEVAAQQIAVDEAAKLKAERRRQQEENVRKKAHEQARKDAFKEEVVHLQAERQKQDSKRKRQEGKTATGGKLPKRQKGAQKEWWEVGEAGDSEQDDDVDYYTKEVGEAPDEHFGVSRRLRDSSVTASRSRNTSKRAAPENGRTAGETGKGPPKHQGSKASRKKRR